MHSICEHLATADLCVEEMSSAIEELVERLGFPPPSRRGRKDFPHEGWDVLFARINPDAVSAPTLFELLAPLDGCAAPDPRSGRLAMERQKTRNIRSHATVVMTNQLDLLVDRVRRRGIRHWLQPIEDERAPFPRLWIGVAPNDLTSYDPSVDYGLMLEFVPTTSKTPARPRGPAQDRPDEAPYTRIAARDFIVKSVENTAGFLQDVFGWSAQHQALEEPERGYRFVTLELDDPFGAALRLVQPLATNDAEPLFLADNSPGAGRITIVTADLEGVANALAAQSIDYRLQPAGRHEPETIVPQLPVLGEAFAIVAAPKL